VGVSAEVAITEWVNGRVDLVGIQPQAPGPLSRGAYLKQQRSPADGAYAVIDRQGGPVGAMVAEMNNFDAPRITATIRAGTIQAAEAAAAAYATAVRSLTGCPEPCGGTGVTCLASDNVTGPQFVPQPADSGEQYCFQVTADLILLGGAD
jgi:hypothetical protein